MRQANVFLSYAHDDDQMGGNGGSGWVTTFAAELRNHLSLECKRRGGTLRCEVWMDKVLAPNQKFDERISRQIGNADAFVAVLSTAYLQSWWCGREGTGFLAALMGRFPQGGAAKEGVFLVDCENVWKHIGNANSPLWGGCQEPQADTLRFVQDLKRQITGSYPYFLTPPNEPPMRICEPIYNPAHREAGDFFHQTRLLASDLIDHILANPPAQEPRKRVLLAPPLRNTGLCWKEFEKAYDALTLVPQLEVLPLFPQAPAITLQSAKKLVTAAYLEHRNALLQAVPEADILVQVLTPIVTDWDSEVVQFWQQGEAAIRAKTLGIQMHLADAEIPEILATVDSTPSVEDKENARRFAQTVIKYNSSEDLAALVLEQARRLSSKEPAGEIVVLVEMCTPDLKLAEDVQRELAVNGLQYQNRAYFQTDQMLPKLEDIRYDSVIFVCEKGRRNELLERANGIAQHAQSSGRKIAGRGALFYRPPQVLGFAAGSSFAFDQDFPIVAPDDDGTENAASEREQALRTKVAEFSTWVKNKAKGSPSGPGAS